MEVRERSFIGVAEKADSAKTRHILLSADITKSGGRLCRFRTWTGTGVATGRVRYKQPQDTFERTGFLG